MTKLRFSWLYATFTNVYKFWNKKKNKKCVYYFFVYNSVYFVLHDYCHVTYLFNAFPDSFWILLEKENSEINQKVLPMLTAQRR